MFSHNRNCRGSGKLQDLVSKNCTNGYQLGLSVAAFVFIWVSLIIMGQLPFSSQSKKHLYSSRERKQDCLHLLQTKSCFLQFYWPSLDHMSIWLLINYSPIYRNTEIKIILWKEILVRYFIVLLAFLVKQRLEKLVFILRVINITQPR